MTVYIEQTEQDKREANAQHALKKGFMCKGDKWLYPENFDSCDDMPLANFRVNFLTSKMNGHAFLVLATGPLKHVPTCAWGSYKVRVRLVPFDEHEMLDYGNSFLGYAYLDYFDDY